MPTQVQINAFSQVFHQVAIVRLAAQPALVERALHTISRWQAQRGLRASDPYLCEWQTLLGGDLTELQRLICADDDHAATLRNASPLGFVMNPAEQHALRCKSMGLST